MRAVPDPVPDDRPPPREGRAALAGALAAGTALATGELVGAVTANPPSLIAAVGDELVDRYAASLKDLAVELFGTNDKLALLVGIVVVSLALGALLGLAGRRRFPVAATGLVGFGGVGVYAGLRDPLGSATTVWAATVTAVAAGIVTLWVLLRVACPTPSRPDGTATATSTAGTGSGTGDEPVGDLAGTAGRAASPGASPAPAAPRAARVVSEDPRAPFAARRSFLAWSGGIGAWAALAGLGARGLRARSTVETERATVELPRAAASTRVPARPGFDVPGLTPYLVPNGDFYRIDTALTTPQVESASWSLRVEGMVDRPFELTYDELLAMDLVEVPVTLSCVSNEVGGDLVGNAEWLGVPLARLLERAGAQDGATQVVGESVDGFTAGFPTDVALDGRTALVAVGMNGEPLPVRHGYPARLVVSGLYGYVSATKWLATVRLTTWEGEDGYWIPRGWAKEAPVKLQSRIDVPRDGADVSPGPTPVAGVAWAPSVGVSAVEVQVDGGSWEPARLGETASDDTWVQWVHRWDATPGEHELRVRAVDADGEVQTDVRRPPAPDGATGWHTRRVDVSS